MAQSLQGVPHNVHIDSEKSCVQQIGLPLCKVQFDKFYKFYNFAASAYMQIVKKDFSHLRHG